MENISIISSPLSFTKDGEMNKIRQVIKEASGIVHYEVLSHKGIKEALSFFAKIGVSVIIILGDRALSSAIFEIILKDKLFGDEIPSFALLPSGENNIIAQSLGAESAIAHKELKRVFLKHKSEKLLNHVVNIPIMRIEGVMGIDTLHVLSFAVGEIIKEKYFFQRKKISLNFAGRMKDKIMQQKTLRLAKFKSLTPRTLASMIRMNRNGRGAVVGQFYMILLSSLDEVLPRVYFPNLGEKAGLNFVSVENNAEALTKLASQIFKGEFDSKNKMGHVIENIEHMRIAFNGEFIADGEIYDVDEKGELDISIPAHFNFIKLNNTKFFA